MLHRNPERTTAQCFPKLQVQLHCNAVPAFVPERSGSVADLDGIIWAAFLILRSSRYHSRRTNSKPSSFFAHNTIELLFRKLITAGSITAGSPFAKVASATT